MSQISPPLRILLVGSILFLAVWMVALKPGGATAPPPPAPAAAPATAAGGEAATTSAGQAVEAANNAAAAADARAEELTGEDPAAAAAPATSAAKTEAGKAAAAKADVAKAGLPKPVAKAVAEQKVLVLFFWNPKAADDRIVRKELRSVGSNHKKDVAVHVANVNDIARYAPVTKGAEVEQSPSVVVIGADRKATLLEGFSDRATIRQAVYDALRAKNSK